MAETFIHKDKYFCSDARLVTVVQDELGQTLFRLDPWRTLMDYVEVFRSHVVSETFPGETLVGHYMKSVILAHAARLAKGNLSKPIQLNLDLETALQERMSLMENNITRDKLN